MGSLNPFDKGGSNRAPPSPDPATQIRAEAEANRYNIVSPFGSQTWSGGQNGQPWTQTVALNPSEQAQYDTRNAVAEAMLGQARSSVTGGAPGYTNRGAMPSMPGNLQNPSDAAAFNPNMGDAGRFSPNGEFNPNMRDPGTFSLNGATPEASRAHYARIAEALTPTFERQTRGFEQRMSNAGLPVGSEAYNEAFGEMLNQQDRTMADAAYESAEMAPQLALAERGQQMADRGQMYDEGLSTRQQRFGEGISTRQQQMADRGQLYGEGLSTRQQQQADRSQSFSEDLAAQADARTGFQLAQSEQGRVFDEDLARRQQYYNEIAAALGGAQLNPVNGGGNGGNAPLDVGSAYNAYNQSQLAAYNASQGQQANMMNGLFGLGSSLIGNWQNIFSDERLKDDIDEVGELPTGDTLYEYHYTWEDEDEPKHVGVMAQELEQRRPDFVTMHPSGFRQVNYRGLLAEALAEAA